MGVGTQCLVTLALGKKNNSIAARWIALVQLAARRDFCWWQRPEAVLACDPQRADQFADHVVRCEVLGR